MSTGSDDDVIEDGDAEERADVNEPLGDGVILSTRRRIAARVDVLCAARIHVQHTLGQV